MSSDKMVVLITGRGNNTLTDKNIIPVCDKPLLSYGAEAAKKVNGVSDYYISSDDDNILNTAHSLGYTKIKRPDELGSPEAKHGDAVYHAVQVMKVRDNVEPDILVIMMANCATIKTSQIEDCIKLLKEDESLSTVAPVIQNNDHHPFRAKRIREDGLIDTFVPLAGHDIASNRQQLEPNYFLCHSFYVLRVSNCFKEDGQPPWNFMGNKVKPYIVDYSLDVHSKEDIVLTENWVNENKGDM
tara:strand:+ start:89 stop:814 length:726 start_codon:yes stop_codon:yes gene_type:complete